MNGDQSGTNRGDSKSFDERPLEVLRRLDLCERYSLARDNIGAPPNLCSLATFKVQNEKEVNEIRSRIQERIEFILENVPHLSLFVDDTKALFPKFARFQDKDKFDVQDILISNSDSIQWTDKDEKEKSIEEQLATIQTRLLEWEKENLILRIGKPLWHVHLIQSSANSQLLTVALTIHHIIVDGRSMNHILAFLIAPSSIKLTEIDPIKLCGTFAAEHTFSPPNHAVISSINNPSKWTTLKVFFDILFSLAVPKFIKNLFGLRQQWPSKVLDTNAFYSPEGVKMNSHVIMLRGGKGMIKSVLQPLREECKKNGIPSIHPALHTACLISLRSMIKSNPKYKNIYFNPIINTQTPMSLRNEIQCGIFSGNYVGQYVSSQRLSNKNQTLWKISKIYSDKILSPNIKKSAPNVWNMLKMVFSDNRLANNYNKTKDHPDGPTIFEMFLNGRIKDGQKNKLLVNSLEISNTGMLTPLDYRIIGISWKQTNTLSTAITVDVCRWKMEEGEGEINDGLTLSIGFQKGIFVTQKQEEIFVKHMRESLNLLLSGKWSKDLTVNQLFSTIEKGNGIKL